MELAEDKGIFYVRIGVSSPLRFAVSIPRGRLIMVGMGSACSCVWSVPGCDMLLGLQRYKQARLADSGLLE